MLLVCQNIFRKTDSSLKNIQRVSAKHIDSPIQITESSRSNDLCGHRYIKLSTYACTLLLQTFVTQWVALRSSVKSSTTKDSTLNFYCYYYY